MTERFFSAITADRKVGLAGERGKSGDQVRCRSLTHLASVEARVSLPSRRREGLGKSPGDNGGARSQFGQPHVEVIPAGEILLAHAAWRTPHGSQANSFAGVPRTPQPDDANGHEVQSTVNRMMTRGGTLRLSAALRARRQRERTLEIGMFGPLGHCETQFISTSFYAVRKMHHLHDRMPHRMKDHTGGTAGRSTTTASDRHVIQFYDTDESLCTTVSEYLAEGRRAGEALLIIASADHRAVIAAALREKGVDESELVFADAQAILSTFMVGDRPDEQLFRSSVGALITAAAGPAKMPVRAYGEMVDLLVCSGNVEAALLLEEFWNDLAAAHSCSILCAHSLENFYGQNDTSLLNEVCRRHARANPCA